MATAPTNSTAKAVAAERSVQVVTTAANLMRLLKESAHSEMVGQLPKDLASKAPNIRSTGKLLEQMPAVIVALDTHIDDAIKSALHLGTVSRLLSSDG
ncbi:unnamed protein product [Calypogeia fissa]